VKAVLALAALALAAPSTPSRLPPIDQCAADSDFVAFRAGLARAADRQNVGAIMAALDDKVLVDLGGGYGKAAFAKAWNLDDPKTSRLWAELKTILRLGCARSDDTWLLPSMFEQIGPEIDTLETYLAIVPESPLRQEPRNDGAVVARLDWDLLALREVVDGDRWYLVSLRDGRQGYVRADEVRNPLDYRMAVRRDRGAWRITAFVAGD
jgi:hypothetical protein